MADKYSREIRSRMMSAVKSKDTRPEIYLRKLLFKKGYRFRKNSPKIKGHPDIWLRKYNTAIFINGCFWHAHKGCQNYRIPKSNTEFWILKFSRNIERDKRIREELNKQGIKELVIWECAVNQMKKDNDYEVLILNAIDSFLHSASLYMEIGYLPETQG